MNTGGAVVALVTSSESAPTPVVGPHAIHATVAITQLD